LRTPTRRHRGAVVLAVTAAALLVPATAAHADVAGEFENGTISNTANAKKSNEAAASAGVAVEMWDPGYVQLSVTSTAAVTTAFRIRARQEICGSAAAQMAVKVDGVAISTVTVSATTYTDYTVSGNWAAGAHTVRVDFANAYHQADCVARELWLDKVTAVSRVFYVDQAAAAGGNGLTQATAFKTIANLNAAVLKPGDTVLFKTGQTWTNPLLVANTAGTASARITYGSYGGGTLPIFDGGAAGHPIDINAAYVTVKDVQVRNAGGESKIGLGVYKPDAIVQNVTASGNAIGIQAYAGAHRLRITGSNVSNNKTVINPDGLGYPSTDDYGATGISVLAANDVEVDHNTISGNVGPSADFGYDGSAVEVFGAVRLKVHHNTANDNQTFSELGNTATSNAWFYDNVVTTSASFVAGQVYGINIQGTGEFGPVLGTKITNNTFVLRNADAGVLIVGADAGAVFHNNIVQADAAGYTNEQKIDEGHNIYYGWSYIEGIKSTANTSAGGGIAPSSKTANPLFVSSTDYHLQSTSPAKNWGVDAYTVTTDRGDQPRVVGGAVDAGAYEIQ
jgi:hypothetical protein